MPKPLAEAPKLEAVLPKPPVVAPKPEEGVDPPKPEEGVEPKPLVGAGAVPKPDTLGAPLAKPLPEKPPIFPNPLVEGVFEPKVEVLEADPKVLFVAGGVVVEKRPVGTGLDVAGAVEKRPVGTGLEAAGACQAGAAAEVALALNAARGSATGAADVDFALKAARGSEMLVAGAPKLKPVFLAAASPWAVP